MEKVKFVNGIIENEIINHNKKTANGLTNTEMYRTANKGCYETFWFSVKGLATKGNPFVKANDYTVAYLDSWATDTVEHYVKINGKWYYATEKQVETVFDQTCVGEEDDEMYKNYDKDNTLNQ